MSPGGGRMRLWIPPAYDDQVLVDDSWCGECDRLLTIISAKIFAEVDTPILPEAPDRSAVARIECVEEVGDPGEESAFRIVRPPCEAAYRLRARHAGIEAPEQLACSCVKRDDLLGGRVRIKRSLHDERARLQANALFSGVVSPRDRKFADIVTVDLSKRRVVIIGLLAAIDRPITGLDPGGSAFGVPQPQATAARGRRI